MNTIQLIQSGLTDYNQIWDLQRELLEKVTASRSENYLILTEHNPVITIGKSGNIKNLLVDESYLKTKGIEITKIDRGGDITFHGPGQLVGYPILNLSAFEKDVHWYLRKLEEIIIKTLEIFGIEGKRIPGLTGVWVGDNKICAIGVKVTRWVSMHGFALNLSTDLNYFKYIVPCGISDKGITSILKETGNNPDKNDVINNLCTNFEKILNVKIENCEDV
ncbi:Octanoyltransferase [subsurface metagenome]